MRTGQEIRIEVDADTWAGLEVIRAEGGYSSPAEVAASLVTHVVADDLAEHEPAPAPAPGLTPRRIGFVWWLLDGDGAKAAGPFGSRKAAVAGIGGKG